MSEVNVPKLRFREFEGEWVEKRLGDIGEIVGGGTPKTDKKEYWNGDIEWFTPTEIKSKYIKSSKRKISELGLKKSSAKILPIGTLLLTSRATVGDVGIAIEKCTTNQGFQSIIVNDKNNNEFIYYWILKNKKEFLRRSSGSTFIEISKHEINKIGINLPQKPEQQKIANFLTSIDQKIEQLTEKEKLLVAYKKGMMQKIFSQDIRFRDENGEVYGDWVERKLGEISNITTGSSNREDSSLDGEYTFFDRSEDIRTSSIFLFDTEAVIVAGEGQKFIPKFFIGKFDLHQRTYAIMDFNGAVGKFIYYYIYKNQNYFLSQAVGSTVKSLRLPMFKKMKINLPCLEEQTKIANFLSSIDKKIEQVNRQIEESKGFKKGLLQQMFV